MAGLAELSKLCNGLPDRIVRAACDLKVRVTQTMADDLIEHTPVDTSEAESNWQASLGGPPAAALPAIVPGSRGSTAEESATEARAHVARALADTKPGEVVYLSNLAPYIEDLNVGSSSQEPAGFFERGVRKGELFANATGLEVKG